MCSRKGITGAVEDYRTPTISPTAVLEPRARKQGGAQRRLRRGMLRRWQGIALP